MGLKLFKLKDPNGSVVQIYIWDILTIMINVTVTS